MKFLCVCNVQCVCIIECVENTMTQLSSKTSVAPNEFAQFVKSKGYVTIYPDKSVPTSSVRWISYFNECYEEWQQVELKKLYRSREQYELEKTKRVYRLDMSVGKHTCQICFKFEHVGSCWGTQ